MPAAGLPRATSVILLYKGKSTPSPEEYVPPFEAVFTPSPEEDVPAFEAVFAIAGLLAVAYLLRRRK